MATRLAIVSMGLLCTTLGIGDLYARDSSQTPRVGSASSEAVSVDWVPVPSGTTQELRGIWGSSPSDIFAVGTGGAILHYDGSAWASMASPTAVILGGVWGSSETDVFATGDEGTLLHYDGVGWTAVRPFGCCDNGVKGLVFNFFNKIFILLFIFID